MNFNRFFVIIPSCVALYDELLVGCRRLVGLRLRVAHLARNRGRQKVMNSHSEESYLMARKHVPEVRKDLKTLQYFWTINIFMGVENNVDWDLEKGRCISACNHHSFGLRSCSECSAF